MKGKVRTVLGDIEPAEVGMTSMHEHLFIDFTVVFQPPVEATAKARAYEPVSLSNLGRVRYNPFGSFTNLLLLDQEEAIEEVGHFTRVGGGTIVDVTTIGIGRDPAGLGNIARATGANIVMGAGYYIAPSHPDGMDEVTVDDLTAEMVADVTTGVGNTGIKAGIIGELGCGWPLHDNERKVLLAAAVAQQETGASILIHPGRDEAAPFEVLDILASAGADVERVVMGHIGRTYQSIERVTRPREDGLLPGVRPVRLGVVVLFVRRDGLPERRPEDGPHTAAHCRGIHRQDRDRSGHLWQAPHGQVRRLGLRPHHRAHRSAPA